MRIFLETERLVLRRLTGDDVDDLFALHADPEVMKYLDAGPPMAREAVREQLLPRLLECYERYGGLGYWAAVRRAGPDAGSFLGWFELRPQEGGPPEELELGYRLCRSAWGHGYATEGARGLVHRAFTDPALGGVRRVFGETMAVNRGSRRVMEKAGLRYLRTYHAAWPVPLAGSERGEVVYELLRGDWEEGGPRCPAAGAPGTAG
ncbi:GNAT family N-acetyltransferase [Streptomyces sp. TP-A0874]|uniref:GNAT family N-acetyltransferase n=1 Tax=Streptomyces sp. TP-A0874 TaxID=549819 RepID=UPI000852C270|nr:GNAT family N-acetyltransferase [Streptomyces sp. TP-A0874]